MTSLNNFIHLNSGYYCSSVTSLTGTIHVIAKYWIVTLNNCDSMVYPTMYSTNFILTFPFCILCDLFFLRQYFRWVENKKVTDYLIQIWDNTSQVCRVWEKLPKSNQPLLKSNKTVHKAVNDLFSLTKSLG